MARLPRRILDALRASEALLSASEIAAQVMTAKGLDAGDGETLALICKCVQSYLRRQSGTLVAPGGRNGRDATWRIIEINDQNELD